MKMMHAKVKQAEHEQEDSDHVLRSLLASQLCIHASIGYGGGPLEYVEPCDTDAATYLHIQIKLAEASQDWEKVRECEREYDRITPPFPEMDHSQPGALKKSMDLLHRQTERVNKACRNAARRLRGTDDEMEPIDAIDTLWD